MISTHAKRMGLVHFANDFCKSQSTCSLRGKRHLGAFYSKDLYEIACVHIGGLNSFIGSSGGVRKGDYLFIVLQ